MKLDIEHLLNMTGQDKSLAVEVLDIFRGQASTWGRMLDASLPQEQWADASHTLKGAALSIGAHSFAEQCAVAEIAGRGDTVSRVMAATLLSDVKTGLSETLDACAMAVHQLAMSSGFKAS